MKRYSPPLIALLFILLTSCKKEKNTGTMGFRLKTENRAAQVAGRVSSASVTWTAGRVSSASITWTAGHIFADKVEFEAEKNDEFEISYEGNVRRKIDLFTSVPQQLTNITIPPGKYDEIGIEIDIANSALDTALVLRGTYNNNGQTIPVLFFINELVELEAEAENVIVNDNNDFQALTTFNLAQLTVGITGSMLNAATITNGTLVISKTNNQSIYNKILENLDDMDNVDIDD
jgi:hypothetical protein